MSVQRMVVLGEVAYAHAVRDFIIAILKKLIPGNCIDGFLTSSDEEFDASLKARFRELDQVKAKEDAYRDVVLEVLGGEVANLCGILKIVCTKRGYGAYYEAHISHKRFAWLVLHSDDEKIAEMLKIVDDKSLTPIDVLRGVGAVLNDESLEERAALSERERRRANAELKSLAADVKSTMQLGFDRTEQKLLECKDEIKSDIAAVDEKVSKLKSRGKRRGKYDEAVVSFCVACVDAAKGKEILRNSKNGKQNLEDVFVYYRGELERRGIADFAMFKRIIHAHRASESRARIKATEAKRDAAQTKRRKT